jgi:hypothetical protein
MILKEAVLAYFKELSRIRPEGKRETTKTSVRIAGLRTVILLETSRIQSRIVNHSVTTFGSLFLVMQTQIPYWIQGKSKMNLFMFECNTNLYLRSGTQTR